MTTAQEMHAFGVEVHRVLDAAAFHTVDDIPRIPHAPDWLPEFTPESVTARLVGIHALLDRWRSLDVSAEPVPVQVDHRLIGSALHRAVWNLEVTRNWERNAVFLVAQVLGPFYDLLVPRPPFSPERQAGLVHVLESVPDRLELAWANLRRAGAADLAGVALTDLEGIEGRVQTAVDTVAELLDPAMAERLRAAARPAAEALASFRTRLADAVSSMAPSTPVGRERFVWFLRHVALLAAEPEELVRAAEQDYARIVVWEALTRNRYRDVPLPPLPATIEEHVAEQHERELGVRAFYEREGLLSQPDTLRHYLLEEMPPYVQALRNLGVPDDLTDEHRLDEDGLSYAPVPGPHLPYFYAANARDPRLGIIHEGAHYQQLALSWAQERPVRRRYADSAPNEGIAHYNEEMMLMAGLFDDAPHSQTIVHNFARLRALRVIVDVGLATGTMSLEEAIDLFIRLVPLDEETAREECAMFLAFPGLAMSYHVGKQQLLGLVADAIVAQGEDFSFRELHDAIWRNGNVPFALQRWELLGDRSEIDLLDAADAALPSAGSAR